MWSGEIDKRAYIQARRFKTRTLEVNGKARQAEEEAKVVEWKAPSGKCTKISRIHFIDSEDKEFKETIKNARKKLETSVAPALPCKNFEEELCEWWIQQN